MIIREPVNLKKYRSLNTHLVDISSIRYVPIVMFRAIYDKLHLTQESRRIGDELHPSVLKFDHEYKYGHLTFKVGKDATYLENVQSSLKEHLSSRLRERLNKKIWSEVWFLDFNTCLQFSRITQILGLESILIGCYWSLNSMLWWCHIWKWGMGNIGYIGGEIITIGSWYFSLEWEFSLLN